MKQGLGKRQRQKCFQASGMNPCVPGACHHWYGENQRKGISRGKYEFSFHDLAQVIACEFQVFICKLGMITLGLLRRSNEITHAERAV